MIFGQRRIRLAGSGHRFGYTLVEVMFAVGIGVLVAAASVSLMLVISRQERLGYVEQRVYKTADNLQDKVTLLLQNGSREAGLFFTDADGGMFHSVVFRDGAGVGHPNEKLTFDPDTRKLTYDPDMSVTGDEQDLLSGAAAAGDDYAFLEDVHFQSGLRVGGIPDSSVVNVVIEVSDRGYGKPYAQGAASVIGSPATDASGEVGRIITTRTFAVNLRRL